MNLQSQSRGGIAVYHPLEFLPHEGRLGDIAFFDSRGKYRWIHNAFHTQVISLDEATHIQALQDLNWPWLSIEEKDVVTESSHQSPKLAVGGSSIMTKRTLDLGTQAAVTQG